MALTRQHRVRAVLIHIAYCIMSLQVIPEVVDNVLDTVNFSVIYGDNAVNDGQHLRPSQAAVCNCFNQCTSAIVVLDAPYAYKPKLQAYVC